ncbi:MAG: Peptidase S49 (SppA) [uncultured bacterium]|nr:MAG: Peptidase S49 (SppA) [uncultured bacterium]
MEGFGFQDILKQFKIESRVLKTGDFKDIGNPFREMVPSEKEYLQQILYNMYNQFKKAVATSRNLSPEVVDDLAQGKIFTGEQAVEKGLVDKLGTVYDAIEEAKLLAGLPKDANVIWPREHVSPWGAFADSMISFLMDRIEGGVESHSGSRQVKPLYMWH